MIDQALPFLELLAGEIELLLHRELAYGGASKRVLVAPRVPSADATIFGGRTLLGASALAGIVMEEVDTLQRENWFGLVPNLQALL